MQSNARETVSDDSEIDIRRLIGILINGRWIIGAVTAVFVAVSIVYVSLAKPVYQADAVVQVEKKESPISSLSDLTNLAAAADEDATAVTEIEIIKSRKVLGDAVDKLNLVTRVRPGGWWLPRHISGYQKGDLVISDFQQSPELLGQEFGINEQDGGRFAILRDGNQIGTGQVGKPVNLKLDDGSLNFTVSQMRGGAGRQFVISGIPRQVAVDSLLHSIQVEEQGKLSGIIKLSLKGDDKDQIVDVLTAVANTYVQQNIERKAEEARKGLVFLNQQLPKVRADLYKSEADLNAFRLKGGSLDVQLEAKGELEKVYQLQAELGLMAVKEAEVNHLYAPQNVISQTLKEQKALVEKELDDAKTQIAGMPQMELEIMRLTRDVQVNETLYLAIFSKVQELEVLRAGTVGNVRVLDQAEAELEPVAPKKEQTVALATLLGLIVGVGFCLIRVMTNPGVKDPEDLDRVGLPVLAVVPLSEEQSKFERQKEKRRAHIKRHGSSDNNPWVQHYLLAVSRPEDLAIEALRSLRTGLHFTLEGARNNMVMICGPSPNVGKTFVTANLGVVLAHAGQRVLLIDADMRRGTLHELFNLAPHSGLSEMLTGKLPRHAIIKESSVAGLHVIGRGAAPASPSELIINSDMTELLAWGSANYDVVIIDTPPILAVTDAAIIGRHVGTTLLVVRHRWSLMREIELTIKRFNQNGIEVQGCVMNGLERNAGAYSYGHGYGYNYGYYAYEYKSNKFEGSDE